MSAVTLGSRWAVHQRNAQRHPGEAQREVIAGSFGNPQGILDLAHRPVIGPHHASWQSMADDLFDTLGWIGPGLLALVDAPGRAVHHAITIDLLATGATGRPRLDDSKRPLVAAAATALAMILDADDVLVAAWQDLVAACRDIDHVRYPSERIAFLRDTLVGLSEHRRQDRGYFSPISTAVQVLVGNPTSVRQVQAMVGDPVDTSTPFDPDAAVNLTDDERTDLAARCILERPPAGKYASKFHPSASAPGT